MMRYIKEYNSFERLFEPIEDEKVAEYYQSKVEPSQSILESIEKTLRPYWSYDYSKRLYDSIRVEPEPVVYGIEDDVFKCFQIRLDYRIKGMYYQVVLNTFYTSDEYFICGIERFKNKTGEFNFSDDFFDCYVYRCDSIEGLVELIKNIKTW